MVILVGASASGKTEVARYLQAVYGMRKATTTTSRPPRKGERDGIDYFFVSKEDFERLFEAGQLVGILAAGKAESLESIERNALCQE